MPKSMRSRSVDPLCRSLRAARIIKEISRHDLAERLGYSADSIGRWERGEHSPSLRALRAWADSLDATHLLPAA